MRKTTKIINAIIVVFTFLAISTGIIDFFRVYKAEKPIFIIASSDLKKDGGSGKYYGLGYQIEIKGNFMPEDPSFFKSLEAIINICFSDLYTLKKSIIPVLIAKNVKTTIIALIILVVFRTIYLLTFFIYLIQFY